jgi:fumarylacetoacetase
VILPWGVARGLGCVTCHEGRVVPLAPLFPQLPFAEESLNAFGELGSSVWAATRSRLRDIVANAPSLPQDDVEMLLPVQVADYVDFYSSEVHASNVGRIFRPGSDPLPPAWKHLPQGYHGRAGTVVVSGTDVTRPWGQVGPGVLAPSARLDVEVELGFVVGRGSRGPVAVDEAAQHILGMVLLNDWSARDIQAFETVPLGPFLGKSFATSISAWVIPLEVLPRVEEPSRGEVLPYLTPTHPWGLDVQLELEVDGVVLSRPQARDLRFSCAQQLAHLTVNGAWLRAGDLIGSGTVSSAGEFGSLLELTWNQGPWLADGSRVVIRGRAGDLELGEVSGTVRGS